MTHALIERHDAQYTLSSTVKPYASTHSAKRPGKEYIVPSTVDDPGVIPEIIAVPRSKKLVK